MKIERVNFAGWKDCIQFTCQKLTLIVTTEVGPRIIGCSMEGKENLFYLNPQQAGSRGGDEWKIYGGHRLWCAPEVKEFTYFPDNLPVKVNETAPGVQFTAPMEKSGVVKTLILSPLEGRNGFKIQHSIANLGNQELLLAPWALTVMRSGGVAVIPHNLNRPMQLLPTHTFSLWSYTDPGDPRWHWGKRFLLLQQDPRKETPQKIGLQNPYGWAGYAVDQQFFLKRFGWDASQTYPDFNANFETYTNAEILELESLAPLQELLPGQTTTHEEIWEVFEGIPLPRSDEDVEDTILPLIR